YPREKTIHGIFEEQVEKTPENEALSVPGAEGISETVTYGELNKMANSLAHQLRKDGVQPDTIVGIIAVPSVEMIAGILAILKAGGAYLPLPPDFPAQRVKYMLEDAAIGILLKQGENLTGISFDGWVIPLAATPASGAEKGNLLHVNQPGHIAYVIYTSGSTGKPKGALIEHRNVVRLMFNRENPFGFTDKDSWTMFHSYGFDFSVWEMYGALLYGGKLVVVPKNLLRDPALFLELLREEEVTVLNQTPTAFYQLIEEESAAVGTALKLRYIIFGGEALNPARLREWKEKYPETRLINMYGITETTVHVTFKEIGKEEIEKGRSCIGTPIPTLSTYIMNEDLKLLPVGVPGELCVGGKGVCRGYLNRPELTAEVFVNNPYKPGERLYRSGDLAVLTGMDGQMEYEGRIDHQVKIRGFRVELGEIEARLLKLEGVKEALVTVYDSMEPGTVGDKDETKYICAYIVSDSGMSVADLTAGLARTLPDYMIPSQFVELEKIPLTPTGKVDRRALPLPTGMHM
ncbi:MAG: amino acid adenylation domain-containing protein, partial [bacterium]|nr:amino acid adenylation domain-containing protein [bacterium]